MSCTIFFCSIINNYCTLVESVRIFNTHIEFVANKIDCQLSKFKSFIISLKRLVWTKSGKQ